MVSLTQTQADLATSPGGGTSTFETPGLQALNKALANVPIENQLLTLVTTPFSAVTKAQLDQLATILGPDEYNFFWQFYFSKRSSHISQMWRELNTKYQGAKFYFELTDAVVAPYIDYSEDLGAFKVRIQYPISNITKKIAVVQLNP